MSFSSLMPVIGGLLVVALYEIATRYSLSSNEDIYKIIHANPNEWLNR